MALHINLYHEVLKAKALKRRDPLKLSMYCLAAVVVCFASYYVLQLVKTHGLNSNLAVVKAEFAKLEPLAKVAKKREEELKAQTMAGAIIVKKVENRFYWAPILEQIMEIVPREVQLTRLAGTVTGDGLRHCSLAIDGLSAGSDPRSVAENLRTDLAEKFSPKFKNVSSKFRLLDDGTEMLTLDGKQVPTATFAINVELQFGEERVAEVTRKKR